MHWKIEKDDHSQRVNHRWRVQSFLLNVDIHPTVFPHRYDQNTLGSGSQYQLGGNRMHVRYSICVTDDQSRTRGRSQGVQGKKEGNASKTRLFISTRLFTLIVQPRVLGSCHLPPYPLCTYSPHIFTLWGSFILYQLFTDTLPFHVVACSCLSHLVSHININPSHRSYFSIYSTYRSGTDTFLSYHITSPSHKS